MALWVILPFLFDHSLISVFHWFHGEDLPHHSNTSEQTDAQPHHPNHVWIEYFDAQMWGLRQRQATIYQTRVVSS